MSKEYDNPSEKVGNTGKDLDDSKKALVFTTDKVVREGNTDMVNKSHHSFYFKKNKIYTVNKKEKS